MRIIIGDVHGCYKTLVGLVEKLKKEYNIEKESDLPITFVGDLIDRGPNSMRVVGYIREHGWDVVTGNHEAMALYYDGKPFSQNMYSDGLNIWGKNGGAETVMSYKDNIEQWVYDLEWFSTLPLFKTYESIFDDKGRYLLVSHAPCSDFFDRYVSSAECLESEGIPNHEKIELEHFVKNSEALIIENRKFASKIKDNNFFNVFGHNITELFKEQDGIELDSNGIIVNDEFGYADVDTGCFVSDKKYTHCNKLTALEFPSLKVIQQLNIDN